MIRMDDFSIRRLVEKDIEFAYQMVIAEGWNDGKNDVKRMFNYEPNGSFIAEAKGSPVGHVFTVNYGRLGWIGWLIVKPEYRRKGVGTLLMKRAVDYLLRCRVETIKLEAVPEISDLYRKLGFVDEFDSMRFRGICRKKLPRKGICTSLMKRDEVSEIARFDSDYFGADRRKVLNSIYQENPKLCFVSYDGPVVAGYILCRKAMSGHKLGPFVCNPQTPQVARELLTTLVRELGQDTTIYAGVPVVNEEATRVFREFGFEQYSKSIRMYFGRKLETEKVGGVFAIGGPMKG
jgi:ribosomal protein S18 acetylase RimI-like enzyme